MMSVHTSTVTTKGQTTVPEAIRKALGLDAGQRLVWTLRNAEQGTEPQLIVRPSRPLSELGGSLASEIRFPGIEKEKEKAASLRASQLARKHHLKK